MKRAFVLAFGVQVCSFASAQVLAPAAPAPAPVVVEPVIMDEGHGTADYIRFTKSGDGVAPDNLQTAVTRFEKDGHIVDLVAVVHLGDASYFEHLNQHLVGYDTVLYEMVGGEHRPGDATAAASADSGSSDEMQAIRQLQQMAKSFLGLEYQLEGIDYTAANFVHADVKWEDLGTLMQARNETLMDLLTRAMTQAGQDGAQATGLDQAAMEGMVQKILSAVLSGNSADLKRTVAPLLGEAESFIARLEGDGGSIVVSERNRIVMEKLEALLARNPRGRYAIFYGAGHMPDLEQRLLAAGFTKTGSQWLDAWTIPPTSAAGLSTTSVSPAELMIRFLSENPQVMSGLQELGTLLEGLGGAMKSLTPPEVP